MNISVDLIKHLPLFARLSDADISGILPFLKLLDLAVPATPIFREGGPGDALFLVLEGEVEIRKSIDSANGSDKSLATLPQGAFFGEMALLTGEPRSATALTHAAPTRLIEVPRDQFLKLMAAKPDVAALLLGGLVSILSERLRATSLEVVTLYETGRIISSTTSHHEMAQRILDRLVRTLGASGGMVLLWNEIVECFECHTALPEMPLTTAISSDCELALFFHGLTGPCRSNRNQVTSEERELGIDRPSVAFAPLITDYHDMRTGERAKKVTGIIVLTSDKPDYFTLPHLTLLEGVAGQVSQALLSSQLLQENESRRTYSQVYVTPDF